ncbi:Kelch repeat-containing protein [Lachnellula hyalina]|uniref:Kelch repeat-containing protein n=1 Tax=Lachnellula hyalina TaxID=1316788 RepID=A0A8H8U1S5_9HELO|nr:Kelch repeat-containing protein [Lachnellula hyalina]TVY27341.1 Kelch repeat-containing protein [Lachnellula hyalina]
MASLKRDIPDRGGTSRPRFTSNKTADRLWECEQRPSTPSRIKPHRQSIFKEEGLDDLHCPIHPSHTNNATDNSTPSFTITRPGTPTTFDEILGNDGERETPESRARRENPSLFSKLVKGQRPVIKSSATAPPGSFPSVPRTALIAFLIAVVVPGFRYGNGIISGADAGLIPEGILVDNGSTIEGRADSPTDVCTRWAHQGNAAHSISSIMLAPIDRIPDNNFLSLDLTKSWQVASPALTGLPQPSGPPAVALGALWNSYNSLFVYGGMFSDSPAVDPLPVSTWEYNIKSSQWTEHTNPQTSPGNYSDGGDQPVQRAAEGAGLSVPELGRSWYFGGHQDSHTTQGWTTEVWRIYLKSFLEFTHPGYANTGVTSLGSSKAAGSDGVYRNITQGGIQADDGFTERADGVLVYVPGWGDEGIILGLAGGTNTTFTEMNIIDIYDVANSTWYKQSTSGTSPQIRVDPCAAVAAAPDGTSFNVYLYGGQNLIPADNQTQFSDMWILTIPSFTWVQVDMNGQSEPPARAGHTCTMRDGQIVVVGGYVGKDISCDSPGIYVFNTSSLQWSNSFTALASSGSESETQQAQDSSVLQGSVGYEVPGLVQSIIGGSSQGGATATSPAAGSATAGPIATGKPPSFTVTKSGSTVVQTSSPTGTSASGGAGQSSTARKSGPNVGAIAAGTIAAALAVLAGYLAFCTWLYRRQLNRYKNHVAMAQRTAFNNSPEGVSWTGRSSEKGAGAGAGASLGPFGTSVGGSGSAGRPSNVESSGSGLTYPSPYSGATGTPASSIPTPADSRTGGYGGGSMPGGGAAGNGYGRLSEEGSEYHGAGAGFGRTPGGRHSGSSAHSSAADLLGGQEPSFFNVVMNPRRTLRVVNSD